MHFRFGPPAQVGLCEPCYSNRPGRTCPSLGPVDHEWRSLARRVTALQEAYGAGSWKPHEAELRFAVDLAHVRWSEPVLLAAERGAGPAVRAGRLIRLLGDAAAVLCYVDAADRSLLPLRQLIDTLAAGCH